MHLYLAQKIVFLCTITMQLIKLNMRKKCIAAIMLFLCGLNPLFAQTSSIYKIEADSAYFIHHPYYGKTLGEKSDGSTPGLSIHGTNSNADSYIFIAESAPTQGYFHLKQKSSGKYLNANSSNSYGVQLQSNKNTQNIYQWRVLPNTTGTLSNLKSASKFLGCDSGKGNDTYVSVFYDKSFGDLSTWHIFKVQGTFEESYHKYALTELKNAIADGTPEFDHVKAPVRTRFNLRKAIESANAVCENPQDSTAQQLLSTAQNIRNLLVQCTDYSAQTLLLARDANMGKEFSVALNSVMFNAETDSVDMILRTANGDGVVIKMKPGSMSVSGKIYTTKATHAESANYILTYSNNIISIYENKTLIAELTTYSVPQYTSVGTEFEWALLRGSNLKSYCAEMISTSKAVTESEAEYDKHGNKLHYAISLSDQTITLDEAIDYHIIQETNPITNTTIDLRHEKAWVIFDNTLPSEVVNKYLSSFKVNGQAAVINNNIRVGIYLNGAVVMPYSSSITPFTGYTGEAYSGTSLSLRLGANNLSTHSNTFRSFILKRGYMATVASGKDGSGYSRVYVADHHDIMVPVLPNALYGRITSVHVKKWQYVSKKGWCSTAGNSTIAKNCKDLRATWFYTWSADRSSTYDTEYIPIRQHKFWPSMSQINGHNDATHVLSFNEPEHAEQHTSDQCSCGGVISEWESCAMTPDFQASGMRIGSPAPTDAGWLNTYIGHCNDMSYRCDFVVMHCYWGTNEAANAQAWYNRLKEIYKNTKRPIWITEWNNGANWTTESWPSNWSEKLEKQRKAIKEILNVLDTCRFVERYAIYNWVETHRSVISPDDGSITPAGKVYRDNKSTFAYNADVQFTPVWWAPSTKDITLSGSINATTGKVTLTVNNPNGDVTDQLVIQRKNKDGQWEDWYTETARHKFDNTSNNYYFDLAEIDTETDEFRVVATTTLGGSTTSNTKTFGYIENPNITTGSKSSVEGWTCTRSAANGYTKATGDTYFEVWNATAQDINFDYYQDITDLPAGIYELSAACFNTVDNVEGATVNGRMGLYAHADGIEYFSAVTEDGQLDFSKRQTINQIAVANGTLRIGIKNIGRMSARWAGADEFKLRYVGSFEEVLPQGYDAFMKNAREESDERYKAIFAWNEEQTEADASEVIVNADCNRKDSYGWTTSDIDYNTGEAFDGNSSNPYWNKWNGSGLNAKLEQTLHYLPAGEYVISAMIRGSENVALNLNATTDKNSVLTHYTKSLTGTGINNPEGSIYTKGWHEVKLEPITIESGTKLTLGFTGTQASGSGWWSVDHFKLTYRPIIVDGIQSATSDKNNGLTITPDAKGIHVTATKDTQLKVYNVAGVQIYDGHIKAGKTYISLPSGIYIINNVKTHVGL